MFTVEAGDELLAEFPYLGVAMEDAMERLEDNPELRAVEVYSRIGEKVVYVGQATAVPDKNWNSTVGWVWANTKITPPASIPTVTETMTDDEFEAYINDAYGDDWAKREGMRQMREDGIV